VLLKVLVKAVDPAAILAAYKHSVEYMSREHS
jgi:hypothetical protein